MRRSGCAVGAALLTALAAAACGSQQTPGNRISGKVLTIYSSVPLQGPSAVTGDAVVNGERLALARAGGRIGRYRIVLTPLDDATAARGESDPGQTTLNARQATLDKTTIGYIGDLSSGATAVSIPLLNRFGIPQISPTSGAVGLTSNSPGASPGEPQKYYPTGERTFARVVPNDAVEAAVQVKLQLSLGCTRTFVLDDREVDGEAAATSFAVAAQAAHLNVMAVQSFPARAGNYSSLAATVAASGADCVLISALTDSGSALLTSELAAAGPRLKLFATSDAAESTYTDPGQGGIPLAVDARVLITAAPIAPGALSPAATAFFTTYAQTYGTPQPYAIFGYEAMGLMLSAINRATDGGTKTASRAKVVAAIFATRNRPSVLGIYSIDADGDTTLKRYGVYRVIDGELSFWKAVDG